MMTDTVSYSFTIEVVIALHITLVLTAPLPDSTALLTIGSSEQNVPASEFQNNRTLASNEKHEVAQIEVNEESELEDWEAKMRNITDERYNRWSKYGPRKTNMTMASNNNKSVKEQFTKNLINSLDKSSHYSMPKYHQNWGNRVKSDINQMFVDSERLSWISTDDLDIFKNRDHQNIKITKKPMTAHLPLNKNRRNKVKVISTNNGNLKRAKNLVPIPATSIKVISNGEKLLITRSKFDNVHTSYLSPIVVMSELTQDGKLLMKISKKKSAAFGQYVELYKSMFAPPNNSSIFAPIFIFLPPIWSHTSKSQYKEHLNNLKKNLGNGNKIFNPTSEHNNSSDSSSVKYVFN